MEALPACFLVPCAFPDDCDNFPLTIVRPDLQLQKDEIIPQCQGNGLASRSKTYRQRMIFQITSQSPWACLVK